MDLREVGCDTRDWMDLAEDRDQLRAYVGGNETPDPLETNQLGIKNPYVKSQSKLCKPG